MRILGPILPAWSPISPWVVSLADFQLYCRYIAKTTPKAQTLPVTRLQVALEESLAVKLGNGIKNGLLHERWNMERSQDRKQDSKNCRKW
jgi:hypothetical protein